MIISDSIIFLLILAGDRLRQSLGGSQFRPQAPNQEWVCSLYDYEAGERLLERLFQERAYQATGCVGCKEMIYF